MIPDERRHLLIEPNFVMLGTIRPDDTVQVNPMWVDWDQLTNTLRFTHTTYRAKYRNLQHNPTLPMMPLAMDAALIQFRRLLEARVQAEQQTPSPWPHAPVAA